MFYIVKNIKMGEGGGGGGEGAKKSKSIFLKKYKIS
jgi:hypothetical protein